MLEWRQQLLPEVQFIPWLNTYGVNHRSGVKRTEQPIKQDQADTVVAVAHRPVSTRVKRTGVMFEMVLRCDEQPAQQCRIGADMLWAGWRSQRSPALRLQQRVASMC